MTARSIVVVSATETAEVTVRDRFYADRDCPYCIHVSSSGGADIYLSPEAADGLLGQLFDRMWERDQPRAEELLDRLVEVASTEPAEDDGSDRVFDRLQDARSGL